MTKQIIYINEKNTIDMIINYRCVNFKKVILKNFYYIEITYFWKKFRKIMIICIEKLRLKYKKVIFLQKKIGKKSLCFQGFEKTTKKKVKKYQKYCWRKFFFMILSYSSWEDMKKLDNKHLKLCALRLVVRTSGFHPGNRGSIPLGRTKLKSFTVA